MPIMKTLNGYEIVDAKAREEIDKLKENGGGSGGISTGDIATNEDIDSVLGGNNYLNTLKDQADQIINEQENLIDGE